MKLSALGYYLDFALAPLGALLMFWLVPLRLDMGFPVGLALGAVLWTLSEYLVHRFVYHRLPYFERLHDAHHAEPDALIGAPPLIGPAMVACAGVAAFALGSGFGEGFMIGALIGYLGYIGVHHWAHHYRGDLPPIPRALRAHHIRHHAAHGEGNYGVVTTLWDHVFRTMVETRRDGMPTHA